LLRGRLQENDLERQTFYLHDACRAIPQCLQRQRGKSDCTKLPRSRPGVCPARLVSHSDQTSRPQREAAGLPLARIPTQEA